MKENIYIARTVSSFIVVLLLMPLGHALMIVMEHFLATEALHYCAFAMGLAGVATVVRGVFVKNDTKATIAGLCGAMLFWTGWVEFLFSYYAWRYGVHCDLTGSGIVETATRYADGMAVSHEFTINGASLESYGRETLKAMRGSRPEYLIMPATLGMWMMTVLLYVLCTRTGCRFFTWIQKTCRISERIQLKPMTRLPAMVTFMEMNVMMWSLYLLLMFCYDPVFLGSDHWFTVCVGLACLAGSMLMFRRQLRIKAVGANIRMAIATVIVFWTFVEVMCRNGVMREIWVDPLGHVPQMAGMLAVLLVAAAGAAVKGKKRSFGG